MPSAILASKPFVPYFLTDEQQSVRLFPSGCTNLAKNHVRTYFGKTEIDITPGLRITFHKWYDDGTSAYLEIQIATTTSIIQLEIRTNLMEDVRQRMYEFWYGTVLVGLGQGPGIDLALAEYLFPESGPFRRGPGYVLPDFVAWIQKYEG